MIKHRHFFILAAIAIFALPAAAQEAAPVALPAPVQDEPASAGKIETAVFAGGCYWGTQGFFEHVAGVRSVVAGMAGPRRSQAEAVRITYDAGKITYGKLLQVFFSVAHDPTQLNRQGPDEGERYRSDIFYQDDQQHAIAQAYIDQLQKAHLFPAAIVTRLDPASGFQRVEYGQQDYLINHPTADYIVVNDLPKIANLKKMYPAFYREDPVRYSD